MSEILFFMGAGASSPFGIPTMKELVTLFETNVEKSEAEAELYKRVKEILTDKYDNPDLEAVFNVIDKLSRGISIGNWEDSAYFYYEDYIKKQYWDKQQKILEHLMDYEKIEQDNKAAKSLKIKFEEFIKDKCLIPEKSFEKIDNVYSELFDQMAKTVKTIKIKGKEINLPDGYLGITDNHYCRQWSIFTTNYDICIESYFEGKNYPINTGFRYDEGRRNTIMDTNEFKKEVLRLFKLHGSIDWFREEDGEIVQYSHRPTRTVFRRRQPVGEVMIYPIAEKYMYRKPFLDIFYHFRNELVDSPCWLIIGYSFRDEAIKNLIQNNINENKMMIVVHPEANKIIEKELGDLQVGEIIPMERYFGEKGLVADITRLMGNQ